jgi:hypothetical protein
MTEEGDSVITSDNEEPDISPQKVSAMLEGVSPGPWVYKCEMIGPCLFISKDVSGNPEIDSRFMSWARDALPVLASERDRLAKELDTWKSVFPDIIPDSMLPDRTVEAVLRALRDNYLSNQKQDSYND